VTVLAMPPVETLDLFSWETAPAAAEQRRCREDLEAGRVVVLPGLDFTLHEGEKRFLSGDWSDERSKNISWDAERNELSGVLQRGADLADLADLTVLLSRYRAAAERLVSALVPEYAVHLETARTSLRTAAVEERAQRGPKDDRLLHVDAFPSRPMGGRRILRVFSNVGSVPRVWRIGEPFARAAARLFPSLRSPASFKAAALAALGVTRGRRSPYDHAMLALHDALKAEDRGGRATPAATFAFPPGSTWIAFTDQVLHAAVAGRCLLEQTFHIPVQAMAEPASSPLRVLERLAGCALAP
jgi:3-deoxy-D-manno-oct-2-ulosonic acid (Kdo) hydroxylase